MTLKDKTTLYDPTVGSKLLTVAQAADYLQFNIFSIRRLASNGSLKPYRKAGRTLLFLSNDLDDYRRKNAWARKRVGLEKPVGEATAPAPKTLKAEVHVELAIPAFPHHFGTRKNFSWEQLPLIKAEIEDKYGSKPFQVSIASPDGGEWTVDYNPPSWLQKIIRNFRKRR